MRYQALQTKLWRELWHMRGQVLAIMLVIVGGVSVCVMSLSTYDSLLNTRDTYYREHNFGQVFAKLKRAPGSLMRSITEIPGVALAESRVIAQVNLEVPGFADPVSGLLTSIPDGRQPRINRLYLVSGRLPDHRRDNEILISDAFSEAQRLKAGDSLVAIINGRRRSMAIVGVALSPEYIYQIAPGAIFPDYKRFGVLWMANRPLSAAYDMDGAFNDVVIQLQPGASANGVIDRLDLLLQRYGGRGAYDRDEQFSNMFLKEEFTQLKTMAYLFPTIFLAVAVFLLNVVITRLVSTQRDIIAILKAFGYSNGQVGLHYAQLVMVITVLGILGGFALGIYLGQITTTTYTEYYRFPVLLYTARPLMFLGVGLVTILTALFGTWRAVHIAVKLPPAEAMRPEPPQYYRRSWLETLGLQRWFSPPGKMIVRHMQKKPLKTGLSIIGLSMAGAIMMVGNFQTDAVKMMMHVQFNLAQQQDLEVTLYEPVATSALSSLRAIPGVEYVEGLRKVPIKLHYQHRSFRTSLQGIPADSQLQNVLTTELENIAMPENGLMVVEHLGHKLGFSTGDVVMVESLEGQQRTVPVTVTALSQQYLGVGSYMRRENVNRLMGEGDAVNTVLMSIDPELADLVYQRLKEMPLVASINIRQTVIESFHNTLKQVLLTFTFINAVLGAVIAFGVVYNTVRIALAEHGRELVSMRVLGYTHAEVAYILLGELALMTLISLPLGFLLGTWLCEFMSYNMKSDLFRVPLVLTSYTYAFSALVVIVSALVSGMLVWRRLRTLDLVEVLKTRE
ncbi:FtsX-like permease family protein [Aestuariicella hydrocarbonica]|uniref:FtsX-like permease family protein n=1 Tax=Pseudomaricurvus hydrocarbonicus TaxID=1470433 RepID=A0A9E5JZT6_9GAMM|nr:ABC transporter permease [Aestuariicella hydrocarbonica]NHO65732.1 FtsX-like permease family protein [Aestuariicella hydrocarbonica]